MRFFLKPVQDVILNFTVRSDILRKMVFADRNGILYSIQNEVMFSNFKLSNIQKQNLTGRSGHSKILILIF